MSVLAILLKQKPTENSSSSQRTPKTRRFRRCCSARNGRRLESTPLGPMNQQTQNPENQPLLQNSGSDQASRTTVGRGQTSTVGDPANDPEPMNQQTQILQQQPLPQSSRSDQASRTTVQTVQTSTAKDPTNDNEQIDRLIENPKRQPLQTSTAKNPMNNSIPFSSTTQPSGE